MGGRDHIVQHVVGFTTICVISDYYHQSCEFESCSWRGVLNTTLCDKDCQSLATGWWLSPGTPFPSANKADNHDITDIVESGAKHHNLNQTF